MKMDMKTSMRMMVEGRKLLLVIILKSSKGECTLFSIMINAASDTPDAAKRPAT
jgi:hypothetical protein